MLSQRTVLRVSALAGLAVIATGVSTTPAFAGGHTPDVRIRIVQRAGAPATVMIVPGAVAQAPAVGAAAPVVFARARSPTAPPRPHLARLR